MYESLNSQFYFKQKMKDQKFISKISFSFEVGFRVGKSQSDASEKRLTFI